jgi:hypothetical protein
MPIIEPRFFNCTVNSLVTVPIKLSRFTDILVCPQYININTNIICKIVKNAVGIFCSACYKQEEWLSVVSCLVHYCLIEVVLFRY